MEEVLAVPAAAAQPTKTPGPSGIVDEETLELLQRQKVVRERLLALHRTNGIAFYRPHYLQHLFHSSTAKRRGLFAGNRFGKSQTNAAETAAWMLGERTWYKVPFDIYGIERVNGVRRKVLRERHPGGDDHPLVRAGIPPYPSKQLIVCTNWKKVEEIWTAQDADRPGKIWQLLPKDWAKGYSNHEGVISDIYGKNGSYLAFMSADAYKRNKLTVESSDWDRIAFDEPAPEGLWKGAARGLVDRNGQGDFTLTSMEEMWIYDRFTDDAEITFPKDNRWHIRGTIYDNPYTSDAGIAAFEADLTEDEKACRLEGHPLELSGLVYKEFHRHGPSSQVLDSVPESWQDYHLPDRRCILYAFADTHSVTPHAVLFFAVGPSEIPVACHEIWEACDADTLAQKIKSYVALTGCFFGGLKVDPSAWIKDASTRTASIAQVLARHDLFPRPAPKDLDTGILTTKSALRSRRVLFSPNLRRTLWEFARYRYDPEKGKPVDENDHMMENLYRAVLSNLRFYSPDSASFPIEDETFTHADLSPIL